MLQAGREGQYSQGKISKVRRRGSTVRGQADASQQVGPAGPVLCHSGQRQPQLPSFDAWLGALAPGNAETLSEAAQDYLAGPAARIPSYTHVQVGDQLQN